MPLARRDDASSQALVLRWGGEQLEGARQALNAARGALKALKATEKKRKQKVWAPFHGPSVRAASCLVRAMHRSALCG